MVIWLFSAHNQPYAFCVVTCTHSQCLPHIFITNVVCTTAALLYIHSDIYLQNIYWVRWLCAKFQWFPCVVCCVRHYQVPLGNRTAHTHMLIQIVAMLLSATAWLSQDGVCTVHHNMCFVYVIFVFALYLDAQRLILNHISPTLPTHTHAHTHVTLPFLSLFVSLSHRTLLIALFLHFVAMLTIFKKKTLRSVTDYHTNTNVLILTCVHARRLWKFYF